MVSDYSYKGHKVNMITQLVEQEDGSVVEDVLNIKQFSPGTGSNCVIAINNKAYCWGANNTHGLLGSGDNKVYYSATEVVSPANL